MIDSINGELCIGCGACVERCPVDILRISAEGKAYAAYPDECMTCFLCERNCPVGAIDVDPMKEVLPPAYGQDRRPLEKRCHLGACGVER